MEAVSEVRQVFQSYTDFASPAQNQRAQAKASAKNAGTRFGHSKKVLYFCTIKAQAATICI